MTRYVFTPTRANGRPAVVMHFRGDDGALLPHGIQVVEVEGGAIAGLHAFLDPALPALFARRGSRAA
jgi:RNA polymerase sigma-70 factor (ECF subfamily)